MLLKFPSRLVEAMHMRVVCACVCVCHCLDDFVVWVNVALAAPQLWHIAVEVVRHQMCSICFSFSQARHARAATSTRLPGYPNRRLQGAIEGTQHMKPPEPFLLITGRCQC